MAVDDFTVYMIATSDKTTRQLNVISVDNDASTMTAYFPGGASGTYFFKIQGNSGLLSALPSVASIETIMEVTAFTPNQASTLGGTKITITGGHFGTKATDNPVKVGDHYCYVITTSDAEITCRIGDLTT